MKLNVAIAISVVFHLSLFALAIYVPEKGNNTETIYRVDLVSLPGGGGNGGQGQHNKSQTIKSEPTQRMKDLTVKKDPVEEPQTKLRYKDPKNSKKKEQEKPKKQELIKVEKKKPEIKPTTEPTGTTTHGKDLGPNVLTTGISSGNGRGSGGNAGGGTGGGLGGGLGSGIGTGSFPYAYYIEALKNKISSSWSSALVAPGSKGPLVAVVYFKIMRNGQMMDLEIKQKSNVQTMDMSALRAIENAAPFPPLPYEYTDRYLGVYFEFIWEKK